MAFQKYLSTKDFSYKNQTFFSKIILNRKPHQISSGFGFELEMYVAAVGFYGHKTQ